MRTIIIQGRPIPVSDDFFSLSREAQSAFVNNITEQMARVADDGKPIVNRSTKANRELSLKEYFEDAKKALGVAFMKKAIEHVGAPGDIREQSPDIVRQMAEDLGGSPENAKWLGEQFKEQLPNYIPWLKDKKTSAEIMDIVRRGTTPATESPDESPQSFIDWKARTDLGRGLQDFGEQLLNPNIFSQPREILAPPVPPQIPQRETKQDLVRALLNARQRRSTYGGPR